MHYCGEELMAEFAPKIVEDEKVDLGEEKRVKFELEDNYVDPHKDVVMEQQEQTSTVPELTPE